MFHPSLPVVLAAVLLASPMPGRAHESAAKRVDLPITRVVLFDTGLGYFEHRGVVTDDVQVDLSFAISDMNDLLKTLVVQDESGGRVTAVTYGAKDPLTRQPGHSGVDVSALPTLAELLQQLRGEQVRVDATVSLTGTIVGLEVRNEPDAHGSATQPEYLNLLTEEGLQSVALRSVLRIQLLDQKLNRELEQALQTVAAERRADKRTVSARFAGEGERTIRLGYLRETPVWKTSYRLVREDSSSEALLQGWAIIENTGETDWEGVQLMLVSGRPISFQMELYEPLFLARPQAAPLVHGRPRPRLHAPASEILDLDPMAAGGGGGGGMGGFGMGGIGGGMAMGGFFPAGAMGGMGGMATPPDEQQTWDPAQGVAAEAVGGEVGALYQYAVETPVDLPRTKSAMLPIIDVRIQAEPISLFTPDNDRRHPLRALRLTNSTDLHLTAGPITVFEDRSYAGDGQILHVRPGERRLISYAVDLETEITTEEPTSLSEIRSARIDAGRLHVDRTERQTTSYLTQNRGDAPRSLVIEHPRPEQSWEIVEPSAPAESTETHLRYELLVAAGTAQPLHIVAQHDTTESMPLVTVLEPRLDSLLREAAIPDEVKQTLSQLASLRSEVGRWERQLAAANQAITEIERQQTRIRSNMEKIDQDQPLFQRYLKTLEQQEDEMDALLKDIDKIKLTLTDVKSRLEALAPRDPEAIR